MPQTYEDYPYAALRAAECKLCKSPSSEWIIGWDAGYGVGTGYARDKLLAEIERLRAIINGVAHFANNEIAMPGMEGWFPGEDTPGIVGETGLSCGDGEWGAETCDCYPTREAAEAAGIEIGLQPEIERLE